MEMIENAPHVAKDLQSQLTECLSMVLYTPNFGESMVGHAKELEDLKAQLLQSSNKPLKVMALVGMGGLGKTTFARRIYDDCGVKYHFDCCGWATLSQEHNKKQALLELCRLMHDDINTENDGEPSEQLRKILLGKRYLIILDDIWTTKAWDDVKRCFPEENENTGSRIILTSRNKEVADYACLGMLSHNMRFLDLDESWNLFYQKLLVKDHLNEEFEKIGRNIVKKCHGLPLAVVVAAGHLSTNMAIDKWKNLEIMLNSLVNLDLSKQFSRILTLSYNHLPCHLKSCLLYLGAFPEDFEIEIKKVIRLWIAEGFIKEVSEKTVEELGEEYLHELINRSLIMVSGRSTDGRIKTCKLHDILHDLCVRKAKNEKLLFAIGGIDDGVEFFRGFRRWLTIERSLELSYNNGWYHFRSILCFERLTYKSLLTEIFPLKMLRVLDISVASGVTSIQYYIMDILLLRYLALRSNWLIASIPVWKNKNLQTLVIYEDTSGKQALPLGIWELPQLRHLEFSHQLSIYNPKVVQLNLQTLYWLDGSQCTKEVFLMIPNVKELGIIPHDRLYNLNCLNKLEKLKVEGSYSRVQLPKHVEDIFPQNLKSVTFSKTLMPWEAMDIISMLSNLEVLKLKNHACQGQVWELSEENGFCRLKHLLISVTELEDWNANDFVNPFPVLEHLVLRKCFKLKEMPSWINRIEMLKSIQLEHCDASLAQSARGIEEEQRECYGEEYGFEILELHTHPDAPIWIEARSLYIATADDPIDYIWSWDFRHEVVELPHTFWLDITGVIDAKYLCIMTCYSAYLVFKFKWRAQELETAIASVMYLKDKKNNSDDDDKRGCHVVLATNDCDDSRSPGVDARFPSTLIDGWMEIKLGDFYVNLGNEGEVEMRLWNAYEWIGKSGLIVKGIEVRPN